MEFENTEFGGITCLVFPSFRISPALCCSGGATGRIQGTSCGSGGPLSAGGDTIFLDLRNFGSTPGTTSAICWDVDCASFAQRFLRSLRAFPLLNSLNFLKGKKLLQDVTGRYPPKNGYHQHFPWFALLIFFHHQPTGYAFLGACRLRRQRRKSHQKHRRVW